MTQKIGISKLSISSIAVHGRYFITHLFYVLGRDAPAATFALLFIFLFFLFLVRCFWYLHSNKAWFYERFSLFPFSILFEYFYIFIQLPILILIIIMFICITISIITTFVIAIASIISSFPMLLTYVILNFFLFYLCINHIFLNFKHMMWLNIVQGWQ